MKIFKIIAQQNGIGYYRMEEPMRVLSENPKHTILGNPYSPYGKYKKYWIPHSVEELKESIQKYEKVCGVGYNKDAPDIFFAQSYDNPFYFSLLQGLRDVYKRPLVVEIDDYVFDVPNTNAGKTSYHERNPNHQDVNDALTWHRKGLGHTDAYIVTTPFLERFYKNYATTYICPNSIDLRKRKFVEVPHKKHDEIRLGFSASGAHQEGMWYIEPVIEELMKRHKNLVFYYYGGLFDIFKDKWYKSRVKKMKWVKLEDYPKYLHDMDFDITIAPLTDRMFNRAKSNLRLLEYWSSGKYPVVASPVGHYAETIIDGKNGLLATERDEWVEKIEQLIQNPALRKKLGEAGFQTVKKDYNLEKNARLWERAFNTITSDYITSRKTTTEHSK